MHKSYSHVFAHTTAGKKQLRLRFRQNGHHDWRSSKICSGLPHGHELSIKVSLAKSSGSLDLGWLGLDHIPAEIFEIEDLEVSCNTESAMDEFFRGS